MDGRAAAVGIRGADLGVSIADGSKLWLVFGDTNSRDSPGSSSVIESGLPFDCSSYTWLTSGGKLYQPLISARKAGSDESTVPAGGITINHDIYIYSMRVNHWGLNNTDPTHAHGVLFKRIQGSFIEVVTWPTDQLFVNAAPLEGELSNGARAIFIATSGHYRHSPIYLSYVLPEDIEKPTSYHYLTGYRQNGSPLWASEMAEAKPIPGLENVRVGELSFLYDAPLKTYLLMFVDYSEKVPSLDLYTSRTPYGPFYGPEKLYPCGTGHADQPQWMEKDWGGCYGGYMLPDSFGPDGHDLYFTLSVWNPYTTVIMKTRISSLSMMTTTKTMTQAFADFTTSPLTQTSFIWLVPIIISAIVVGALIFYSKRRNEQKLKQPMRTELAKSFCIECGKELPPETKLCNKCGTKQT
jgi:ribosomal protein L40E